MAQKSVMELLGPAITAWVQHVHSKIQIDYQAETGASLEEITLTSGGQASTLEFRVPDKKEMTGIKTQEKEVWVPATRYPTKDKDGRLTMRNRKAHKRTQKIEIKDGESSSPRSDSKPSKTGSAQWVQQKIIDYHFKQDFGDFLATYFSKEGHPAKRT
jgi:hypothetical protein